MSIGALLIISSPLLLLIAPELIALSSEVIAAGSRALISLEELYLEGSVIANARVRIELAKYLKKAPDLGKILKTVRELNRNKVDKIVKEVFKQILKQF